VFKRAGRASGCTRAPALADACGGQCIAPAGALPRLPGCIVSSAPWGPVKHASPRLSLSLTEEHLPIRYFHRNPMSRRNSRSDGSTEAAAAICLAPIRLSN